ncbi:helix-turn-helix domain-containing protein [Marinicella sp. S1101]|nr:helix-turn-helix domain-containing protein [Marinicella marina]
MTVCPMTYVLEILGDKWSFLIIRDMLFKGCCQYKQFIESDEGMATNILANRLKKLTQHDLITQCKDPNNGRQKLYHLTTKGLDLVPAILHLIKWSGKHDSETLLSEKIMHYLEHRFDDAVDIVKQEYRQKCHVETVN